MFIYVSLRMTFSLKVVAACDWIKNRNIDNESYALLPRGALFDDFRFRVILLSLFLFEKTISTVSRLFNLVIIANELQNRRDKPVIRVF